MTYRCLSGLSGAPTGAPPGSYPQGLTEEYWSSTASSSYQKPVNQLGPVAEQCNQSVHPGICFYAKTQRRVDGTWAGFLGRKHPTQDEFRLWEKWSPPGQKPVAMDQSTGEPVVPGAMSDTVFYGGLAAAAAVVAGALWYYRRTS